MVGLCTIMMEMNAVVMVVVVAAVVEMTLMKATIICIVFVPFNVKYFVGLFSSKANTPFAFIVKKKNQTIH